MLKTVKNISCPQVRSYDAETESLNEGFHLDQHFKCIMVTWTVRETERAVNNGLLFRI